jgi:ribosomal protein S18 acetylase RimI-like enzyme
MDFDIIYRKAILSDAKKLSILLKQVYIQTYGTEGVSDEFANFIVKQFAPERIHDLIEQDPDQFIVAEYNGNLVGALEIEYDKKCHLNNITAPEISKLYILEWFCGKGIGYRLITEAEDLIQLKGYKAVWLWVLNTNERAIAFYERQHYKWIGNAPFQMEKNLYDNKVMWKEL